MPSGLIQRSILGQHEVSDRKPDNDRTASANLLSSQQNRLKPYLPPNRMQNRKLKADKSTGWKSSKHSPIAGSFVQFL